MNAHHVRRMVMAAGVGLAAACHAQWTGQLLNNFAVTNEAGQMIVLDDGGGYYQNNAALYSSANAFTNSTPTTWYDAQMAQGAWAGFGFRTPKLITRVRYAGRTNVAYRVTGTIIQGATRQDFSDAVTLWTLSPPSGWNGGTVCDEAILSPAVTNVFSYVRFVCTQPATYGGNFTHVEFYGADPLPGGSAMPTTPALTFNGCINWRENLLWTGAPASTVIYEIQRRIAFEDNFAPLACAYAVSGEMRHTDMTFMMYQDTDYRIRALSNVGESPWVTVTGLARNGATGTWIGTQGTWGSGMTGDKAFDGNVTTYFDAPSSTSGNGCWTGLDFGSERELTALRFVPRRDSVATAERMQGGWFEVADNASFANPTVLYTVPNVTPPLNVVTEITLAQPVTARYARYCSRNGGWGNVAEVEFVQDSLTPPRPPNGLAVASSDITNAYAVLTWRVNDVGSLMSSVVVYRATSPGGPYTLMTPDGLAMSQTAWTNTAVTPSIRYYYRLASLLNTAGAPIESAPSAYVAHIPYMRIERAWSDLTHVKPGMTLLGTHYPIFNNNPALGVQAIFDGSATTYADILERNPAIGVDLAKPYCVQFIRHVGRRGGTDGNALLARLNGAELRGSNDPNYTNSFTRLATFAGAVVEQYVTQQTVTQEAFRYIFIQRPTLSDFYGNLNELELYGWDPDIINSIFKAPTPVSLSIPAGGGVRLDWTAGTQQTTYRVERSANGVDNWQTIGDTQGAATFTDSAPVLNQRAFYRVTAVRVTGQGEESAWSDAYSIIAYVPGNGTGLTAAYYPNFYLAYSNNEACAGTFIEPAPNFTPANTDPIRSDVPNSVDNIRIVWYGNLAIPFTGNYTFYVTSDDGYALSIDGQSVLNKWLGKSASEDTVTLPLTAGQHLLRLDYFNVTGGKRMTLEWGGPIDRGVIPTLQLTPLPLPTGEDVFVQTGPWLGRTFKAERLGYHTLNPDGSITVGSAGGQIYGTNEGYHYVWQGMHGDFIFEAKAYMDIDPLRPSSKALLMVRDGLPGGSPFFAAVAACSTNWGTGATGQFNVNQRIPPTATITDALSWSGPFVNPFYLRIKREKGVFTFAYRDPASPPNWVTYYTFADTGGIFAKDLYVGLGVSAPVQTSANMFQTVTFSEIKLQRLNTGTMLLIR